jgi:hypothetical protein
MGAGALCGVTSWALIYPIDTARAIYQERCLRTKLGTKVPKPQIVFFKRDMYRGLGISMINSVLKAALFFSAFEAMKKYINGLEDKPRKINVKDLD